MKISQKGPADAELPKLIKNDKPVSGLRRNRDLAAESAGQSSRVSISPEARQLQRIAELAHAGDRLRAEKTAELKQRIANGEYRADPQEVAKDVLRAEVSRLLGNE